MTTTDQSRVGILLMVAGLLATPGLAGGAAGIAVQKPKVTISECAKTGNCPPQGSISITSPASGKTWFTGSYQVIEWSCNNTQSNSVDVSLWQNNGRVAPIWTGATNGRAAYIVPFTAASGSYELRVTSQADNRVEARLPVSIGQTSMTLTTTPSALLSNRSSSIGWSYTGSIPSLKLATIDSAGTVLETATGMSAGTKGKGSWSWTAPVPPAGQSSAQYRLQLIGTFHSDVKNNKARSDVVLATSAPISVRLPKLKVAGDFIRDSGATDCSPGKPYAFSWTSELDGRPVKIELYKGSGTLLQTIVASQASGANNSITWTAPDLAETRTRTALKVRVTSLDIPAVTDTTPIFYCGKPLIEITSPDPQQQLVRYQSYPIGWKYYGDAGQHVRIEVLITVNRALSVFDTPAQSTPIQTPGGPPGQGQFAFAPGYAPIGQIDIRVSSIEKPGVSDLKTYRLVGRAGASASGSTGTSTSTNPSTSTSPSTSTTGPTTTKMLTADSSFNYNASDSAVFLRDTTVTLDAKGYALSGILARQDQTLSYGPGKTAVFFAGSLVTFENGYITSGLLTTKLKQSLEYGSNRLAKVYAGASVKIKGGYLTSSILDTASSQVLAYGQNKTAEFFGGSVINFLNGYVLSGFLTTAHRQALEYTSGKTVNLTAGSRVVFDGSGRVRSGWLATSQSLEYKAGESVVLDAYPMEFRQGGYVKCGVLGAAATLPKLKDGKTEPTPVAKSSYVAFDGNGNLKSFNLPTYGGACYKCDLQSDPGCTNNTGLPLCKDG